MNNIEQELFNRVKTHLLNDDLVYNGLRDSGIDMSGKALSILWALQHIHDSHKPSEWSESIDRVEMQLA